VLKRCVSAPGKVILFGEHFVVEGVPAIASAIGLRVRACVDIGVDSSRVRVIVKSDAFGEAEIYPAKPPKWASQFRHIVELFGKRFGDIIAAKITIESSLPVGAGLGSSAASAVAFTAAYGLAYGIQLPASEVSQLAFEAEKLVHGKPSGIDNTVSCYGGTILYARNEGFKPLNVNLPPSVKLVIADSGIQRSTAQAVSLVLARKQKLGKLGNMIYSVARELVLTAVDALKKADIELLGELMDVNHGLLNAMGVSLPELETLVHRARKAGAYGAKITGAGLGGTIIALVDADKIDRVVKSLNEVAARVYTTSINSPGLKYD